MAVKSAKFGNIFFGRSIRTLLVHYFLTRYLRISSAHAQRMIAPLMMYRLEELTPSMVSAMKMIRSTNTPRTMPLILPVPPTKE